MKMMFKTDYKELAHLLDEHEIQATPAEIHGILCGLICGGIALDGNSWQEPFNDLVNDGFGLPAAVKKAVNELYQATSQSLYEVEYTFDLLLPGDQLPLDERTDAMAQWVQSYLVGFGICQKDLNRLSAELREVIEDFAEIAQVSAEFDQEDEIAQQAYSEVIEYLRVGVLLGYAELGSRPKQQPQVKPTLH